MKITPTNVALALFALLACIAALVSYMSGPGSQDGQTTPMEQAGSMDEEGVQQASVEDEADPGMATASSVAVVDMNRVLLESEAGAEVMRVLSAMNERYLAEVNVLRQELAEDETEANYERLRETAAMLQETVTAEQERYSSLLLEYAERLLAELRAEGGWDLVLDASQVRAHSDAVDLTDQLIAAMNAEDIDLGLETGAMESDASAVGNATQVEGWDEHVAAEEAAEMEAAETEVNATEADAPDAEAADTDVMEANATDDASGDAVGTSEEGETGEVVETDDAATSDDAAAPAGDTAPDQETTSP